MEELAVITCMSAAAVVGALAYFVADLVGLACGLGWRHFSRRRLARKAELKHD